MATEQFTNSAQTTLASSVGGDPSDLSIAVVSATGFPSTPQFRIQIGDELMMVTALAGTTWTVTRGIESTSRTPHSAGDPVTQVFTAGAVTTLVPDQSGNSGKFLTTDGNNTSWTTVSSGGNGGGAFGDGSDGNIVFDGTTTILGMVPSSNTYTLTKDVFALNLTVDVGVTIISAGFRLFALEDGENNGTIHNDGAAGTNGTSGAMGAGGAAGLTGGSWGTNLGAEASAGSNGVRRTTSGNNNSSVSTGAGNSIGGRGGKGGTTATPSVGSSGNSGNASPPSATAGYPRFLPYAVTGIRPINAAGNASWEFGTGGSGGGVAQSAANTVSSGGGGGGAGGVFIFARYLNNTGTIRAHGGVGGNGYVSGAGNQAAGGGGGGGGGGVILVYQTFSGNTPTVAGGAAGTDATNGSGSMGTAAATGANGTVITLPV